MEYFVWYRTAGRPYGIFLLSKNKKNKKIRLQQERGQCGPCWNTWYGTGLQKDNHKAISYCLKKKEGKKEYSTETDNLQCKIK